MKTTVLPVLITDMQIVCQLLASHCPWELNPFAQLNYAPQSLRPCAPRTARVQHSGVRICPEFTRGAACSDRAHPVKSSP